MPAPALVPVLTFDANQQPFSNVSVSLDATILKIWRDGSQYGTSDPEYPYYTMEIGIASWKSPCNSLLARYSGGKLKKEALYQLRGRFFIDMSRDGSKSYLHIDEATRFQGPGTIRSFRIPQFLMVGEVTDVVETVNVVGNSKGRKAVVHWTAKDPYRRDMVFQQSSTMVVERFFEGEKYKCQLCAIEGRMDGMNGKCDWALTGIKLC